MLRTFLIAILCGLAISACDEPGKGPKAEKGYSACAPIIVALNEYKSQTGQYPVDLQTLVPTYLSAFESRVNNYPIDYERRENSFVLHFRYAGPGMTDCLYTPESNWKCHGYY